jgi:hypothetical protein
VFSFFFKSPALNITEILPHDILNLKLKSRFMGATGQQFDEHRTRQIIKNNLEQLGSHSILSKLYLNTFGLFASN